MFERLRRLAALDGQRGPYLLDRLESGTADGDAAQGMAATGIARAASRSIVFTLPSERPC